MIFRTLLSDFDRALCCLLALLLLCGTAAAAEPAPFEGQTLEQIMEQFMQENQLCESNFSMSYYNTVTGESYRFNDELFMLSASTYKLPLNLYFYEMEQRGEITGDTIISWTNRTLDEIHEQSIVYSNNELSEALIYYWGDFRVYKENMRTYFTMTDEEIPPIYYDDSLGNFFCVRMMMDCLHHVYDHSDELQDLLGYLKQAMPDQYFKHYVTEYEIAHKYGYLDFVQNDVGIIYTPQPFLLAVYTQGTYGEEICGQVARLLTDYTLWQGEHMPEPAETLESTVEPELPEAEPVQRPEPEVNPEPEQPVEADPEPRQEPERSGSLWILPAVGLLLLGIWLLHRRRRQKSS